MGCCGSAPARANSPKDAQTEPVQFETEEALQKFLESYTARVYLTGFGSKMRYKNPEAALEQISKYAEVLNTTHGGPENWILLFGGDPSDPAKPDIGYIAQLAQKKLGVKLLAVQCDHVLHNWGGVDKHIDYAFYYPTQKDEKGLIQWGGVQLGEPIGATSVVFGQSKAPRDWITTQISLGGGEIAKEEVQFALEHKCCEVGYVQAECEIPNPEAPDDIYGPVETLIQAGGYQRCPDGALTWIKI
eukprot:TRINITY_DN11170_c0_g1_i1.p2 TRINITY_DN11170_c0_g1~~TRINITY_DN11170_c0_g1_i1.p2  ORF type:complete len:245 (-),score=54.49 TRINITY_DN11170_c0_g1_i1:88-822(-)